MNIRLCTAVLSLSIGCIVSCGREEERISVPPAATTSATATPGTSTAAVTTNTFPDEQSPADVKTSPQEERTPDEVVASESASPRSGEEDAQAAVAVVGAYYTAIAARDFERAYLLWGSSGPPGQTLDAFRKGFSETASVEATTGTPSRVEGAAGSRYVEVPVTIIARLRDGRTQNFEGRYTLRRTVVDGAPPENRRWHLERASIRQRND